MINLFRLISEPFKIVGFQPTPDPRALGAQQRAPLGSPSRDQDDFQLKNKRKICGYSKNSTLDVSGKRLKTLNIEAEREQPTRRQFQRQRGHMGFSVVGYKILFKIKRPAF